MNTFTATVTDDNHVVVTIDGIEVDRPGPWADTQSAQTWADLILADLEAGGIHYPQQPGWIDPHGN